MNPQSFQKNGKFLMLALDHRGSFVETLKKNKINYTDSTIVSLKQQLIQSVYNDMTGLLIDPQYGFSAYQNSDHHEKLFLLCIEKSGYLEDATGRTTELEYEVEYLKNLGASGVKLVLQINPAHKSFKSQIDTGEYVFAHCKKYNLPFFLEFVTYGEGVKSEMITRSISAFLEAKIVPDVFKLEFPGDAHSCDAITQLLQKTPWILLTKGIGYEEFKKQLQTATEHGASGFLAGRALWAEAMTKIDSVRNQFIREELPRRFRELSSIVLKE